MGLYQMWHNRRLIIQLEPSSPIIRHEALTFLYNLRFLVDNVMLFATRPITFPDLVGLQARDHCITESSSTIKNLACLGHLYSASAKGCISRRSLYDRPHYTPYKPYRGGDQ